MPDIELKHIKAYIAEEKDSIDEINHRILFAISETVDRDDEIVTAEAMFAAINHKTTFTANPICLPCHQHRLESGNPPCVGHWNPETVKQLENSVTIFLEFAHDTTLGGEYWKCYSKKHMRAISIGFQSLESHMEDRSGKQIRVITKIELYEISCVAVGCNPGALSELKKKFGWNEESQKDTETLITQIATRLFEPRIVELEARLEDLEILSIPEPDRLAESLLGDDSETPAPADGKKAENPLLKILKIIQDSQELKNE